MNSKLKLNQRKGKLGLMASKKNRKIEKTPAARRPSRAASIAVIIIAVIVILSMTLSMAINL
jgi:hypothetical protein